MRDVDWYTRRGQFRAAFWRGTGYWAARAARGVAVLVFALVVWWVTHGPLGAFWRSVVH